MTLFPNEWLLDTCKSSGSNKFFILMKLISNPSDSQTGPIQAPNMLPPQFRNVWSQNDDKVQIRQSKRWQSSYSRSQNDDKVHIRFPYLESLMSKERGNSRITEAASQFLWQLNKGLKGEGISFFILLLLFCTTEKGSTSLKFRKLTKWVFFYKAITARVVLKSRVVLLFF